MSAVRHDHIDPRRPIDAIDTVHYIRSTAMHSMNEALARDRMREQVQRSRENSLARELAAQRRWHRVSQYARAAEQRHASRLTRVSAGR